MSSKIAEILSKYSKQIPIPTREKLEKELVSYEDSLQKSPENSVKSSISDKKMSEFIEYLNTTFYYCRENLYIKYNGRERMSLDEIKADYFK